VDPGVVVRAAGRGAHRRYNAPMRLLPALLLGLLLLASPAAAQSMGGPKAVDQWSSSRNQTRLQLSWEALPDHAPVKLPDGSEEPAVAPWPFLIYVVSVDSKSSSKIQSELLDETRFRFCAHAVRPIRITPEKAVELPYLTSATGIKDPTLIVLSRKFEVVGVLNSQREFSDRKVLPLLAKAADEEYQIKLGKYVREYIDILDEEEKLNKEEQLIDDLADRGGERDAARRAKAFRDVEEREQALQRARDDLADREEKLKGQLLLKPDPQEALPTTVGSGKDRRELTPAELEAVQVFREFARSDNPIVRAAAVEDLGAIDSGFIADLILKAANDVDPRVVEAAGIALGRLRAPESLQVMHEALRSGRGKAKQAALSGFAAGRQDYPPAVPDMLSVLDRGGDEERRAAILALSGQSSAAAAEPLIRALDDRVPALRVLAAMVLGERREKAAAPRLIELLKDPDWSMQKTAAESLARIRVKESIGPLIDLFIETEGEGLIHEVLHDTLVAITGQDFVYRLESWKKWWEKYGPTFKVPTEAEIEEARQKARDALKGYAKPDKRRYHEIETLSRKMVFVLDISSSMGDKVIVPPGADEKVLERYPSRVKIEIAKRELIDILATLDGNVYFNIITFAGRVKPWQDGMVPGTQRNAAIKFVEKLEPVGGSGGGSGNEQKTNTYGALMEAFGLQDEAVPNWRARTKVDTIFLVTDGMPTIGEIVEVPKLIRAITETNKTRGVVIHVITFDKVSGRRLEPLAKQNGGQCVVRGFED
jgi:HEAT repeat protein